MQQVAPVISPLGRGSSEDSYQLAPPLGRCAQARVGACGCPRVRRGCERVCAGGVPVRVWLWRGCGCMCLVRRCTSSLSPCLSVSVSLRLRVSVSLFPSVRLSVRVSQCLCLCAPCLCISVCVSRGPLFAGHRSTQRPPGAGMAPGRRLSSCAKYCSSMPQEVPSYFGGSCSCTECQSGRLWGGSLSQWEEPTPARTRGPEWVRVYWGRVWGDLAPGRDAGGQVNLRARSSARRRQLVVRQDVSHRRSLSCSALQQSGTAKLCVDQWGGCV